jgi:hypothetical protein
MSAYPGHGYLKKTMDGMVFERDIEIVLSDGERS